MRGIDYKLSERIYKVMGPFDSETLDNSDKYIRKCFSVFDHWLSEEEAIDSIKLYCFVIERPDTEDFSQYLQYEEKFLNFYTDLYNKVKVYGALYSEYSGVALIEFDDIKEYRSHALLSVRERLFLKIVIPEFRSVIDGGHDLTHRLYTLKSAQESFTALTALIKASGLFILE